ncbi:MAG TPA: hypothetical protein VMG12_19900 [Polyangiaceae bacterium]|nr:hypothetical protein [Polyangiaceae bacterium]
MAFRRFCLLALLALGCEREPPGAAPTQAPAPDRSSPSAPGASEPPAPAGPAPAAAQPPAPVPVSRVACRVMSVSGSAQHAGASLAVGATLDRQEPVELGAGSTLHLVHTVSSRQWTLTGPARLFACDRGEEEIVLARGTLRTEPGSGVRPGAEVWVGTPFGSLRYSDARAELAVTDEALRVRVSAGSVWFAPAGGEALAERELTTGTATFPARPYRATSAQATAGCERAASAAEALATALLSPSAEPLGARAREHVRARQRAHASCSSALAALLASDGGATPDERSQAGYSALARSDRQWRGVPDRAASARAGVSPSQ